MVSEMVMCDVMKGHKQVKCDVMKVVLRHDEISCVQVSGYGLIVLILREKENLVSYARKGY